MKSFRDYLKENPLRKGVVLTWGRFNPPSRGHEAVFNQAARTANTHRYDLAIMASHSHDEKNPVLYEQKMQFIKHLFPRYRDYILESTARTPVDALAELRQRFDNVIMVVGEDRVESFNGLFERCNGELNFDSWEVISAGDRDPESDGLKGISSTKMRAYAEDGDFSSFSSALPRLVEEETARNLYQCVREGLGLSSIVQFNRSDEREKFYSGELVKENDIVELKNGSVGKVIRLGANYIIVESEGTNSRHWVSDVKIIKE